MNGAFRIGEFLIHPDLNQISGHDRTHHVEPKAMEVLCVLARSVGRAVLKERLMQAVWADTFVTDEVLTTAIWKLRELFDDDARNPRYIETLPRKGYRLVAELRQVQEPASRYRIIKKLGEGSMGEVFLAEDNELHRQVAFKFLLQQMAGDTTSQKRLVREARAAAVLDHPSICKIYDTGQIDGRSFIAMEYVPGIPITEYCDTHRLRLRQRLELFIQACEATQHAHQKGIIHRDIKPSNVLVEVQKETAHLKMIDFGVAKVVNEQRPGQTLLTLPGILIGTPPYMSPEQVDLTALQVDTRTDIYSLGVLLYELLAGVPPFDARRLAEAGFGGMCRIIRDEDPPAPSGRMATEAGGTETAEKRNTNAATLGKRLKGDLDWITMKALEKDRTRRYASAAELAADIGRHLRHEPVLAGPPNPVYRLRKFVRRHRAGVLATALVVAALMVAVVVTGVGLLRARQEAETARQVSDFLVEIFNVADPSEARGNTVTAREILDRGAERITRQLADQPPIRATLQDTIGRVYTGLGLFPQAIEHLNSALETRRKLYGDNSPQVASTLYLIADAVFYGDRRANYARTEEVAREALRIREAILDGDDLALAASYNQVGYILMAQNRELSQAERLIQAGLGARRKVLGEEHPLVAESLMALGSLLTARMRRYEEGEGYLAKALEVSRKTLGYDHPQTLDVLHQLAWSFSYKPDPRSAEALWRETLESRRSLSGDDGARLSQEGNELLLALYDLGKFEQARNLGIEVVALMRQFAGDSDGDTQVYAHNLAICHHGLGEYAEARRLYQEVEDRLARSGSDQTALLHLTNRRRYASLLLQQKEFLAAEELLRRPTAVAGREVAWRLAFEEAYVAFQLGEVFRHTGREDEAQNQYEQALQGVEAVLEYWHRSPPGRWFLPLAESLQGACLTRLGRYAEAEPALLTALDKLKGPYGIPSPFTQTVLAALVDLYQSWDQPDQAAAYRALRTQATPPP